MTRRRRPLRLGLASPALRRVLLAYAVFTTAEWSTWVALLVWAYGEGGASATATVAVVQLLPAIVVAPVGASLGDRLPRVAALRIGYALQGATMVLTALALVLDAPFALVAAGGAAVTCAVTLTRPVHSALLPEIAGTPGELVAANAGSSTVEGAAAFVGPALSAVLLAVAGAGTVFALMGVLCVGAALVAGRVRVPHALPPAGHPRVLADALQGAREVTRNPAAALLIAMVTGRYVVLGMLDVLVVVLALEVLGTGTAGPATLTSALGLGALAGGAATVVLVRRDRLAPAIAVAVCTTGLPLAALSLPVGSFVASAAALLAASGAGMAFFDVCARTLLQRSVRDEVMSRIFGVQEALMAAALALGAVLARLLVSFAGVTGAFLLAGLVLPAAGLAAWPWIRRLDTAALVPGDGYDRLAAHPLFAGLPPRALERLDQRLRPLTVAPGRAVVRQGEPGADFYLIRSGTARVTQDGRRLRELGRGDGFGEIALLRDVPRTATVTADGPLVVDALDRATFLAVLAGSAPRRSAADAAVSRRLDEDARRQSPPG